jgi:hypothetical protein
MPYSKLSFYINPMKNLKKLFLILLFVFGCSGNSDTPDLSEFQEPTSLSLAGDMPKQDGGIDGMLGGVVRSRDIKEENVSEAFKNDNEDRKLIKRANIRIKAENLEAADISITGLMEKHSAYSASTVVKKSSYNYVIRVPFSAYKAFLAGMDGIGTVLDRSESVEDATIRYYDLEGRLDTKKELLKTFQSYLGKAKNIEEILSVEKRIAELQSDIDRTGKEFRNLSNRVDYATIELVILGPVIISQPDRNPILAVRIKGLFSDFGSFLSDLAVVFIGIVIYGIPILLLVLFFYWILFGKIGILKKLWRMAAGRKRPPGA